MLSGRINHSILLCSLNTLFTPWVEHWQSICDYLFTRPLPNTGCVVTRGGGGGRPGTVSSRELPRKVSEHKWANIPFALLNLNLKFIQFPFRRPLGWTVTQETIHYGKIGVVPPLGISCTVMSLLPLHSSTYFHVTSSYSFAILQKEEKNCVCGDEQQPEPSILRYSTESYFQFVQKEKRIFKQL